MRREAQVRFADAISAGRSVLAFTAGKDLAEYRGDLMLRSAVERQLEILGEALGQVSRESPGISARIPDLRRIIDFRNVLAHGYADVDDAVVWAIVEKDLPALMPQLERLLQDLDAGPVR